MTYKAWRGGYTPENAVSIEYFGLYWHFVDLFGSSSSRSSICIEVIN